ncbi:hypothetical protein C8B47_31020, partial [filamentous cyanobacterium CCP4]
MKRLLSSLSAAGLALLVAAPALALTGRIFQEPDGSVTVYDLTPGSRVRVGVDASPSRTLTTNPCGLLVISPSRNYPLSTVQVNGQVINPSNLPRQIQPPCRAGVLDDGSDTGSTPSPDSDPGSGSSPPPDTSLSDFTPETYNPSRHDWNGDGLVDDATGDGIADDRDSDGHPDGPWGPNDIANSAGPGLTIPQNASVCFGYDGSVVAKAWFFVSGQSYTLSGDDWHPDYDTSTSAAFRPANGPPLARFQHPQGKRYSDPIFHYFEDSEASGYISDAMEEKILSLIHI